MPISKLKTCLKTYTQTVFEQKNMISSLRMLFILWFLFFKNRTVRLSPPKNAKKVKRTCRTVFLILSFIETWCRSCLAAIRNLKIFLTTCCNAGKYAMRDLAQKLPSGNPQLKNFFWPRVAMQGSTPCETWCRSCLAAIRNLNFSDHVLRCRKERDAWPSADLLRGNPQLKFFLTTCCDAGKYAMRDLVQNLPSGNLQR